MGVKISLMEHIEELRSMVLRIVCCLFLLTLLAYPLSQEMVVWLEDELLGDYAGIVIVTNPFQAVMARIHVSMLFAMIVCFPYISGEAFRFISKGLTSKENRLLAGVILSSTILFCMGVLLSIKVLLPFTLSFLVAYTQPMARPFMVLTDLIDLFVMSSVLTGLIFEWPLIAYLLARLGLVDAGVLARGRRHAVISCLMISAVITDPTFITQLILAVPMLLLYEIGIIAARLA
ncbi:twin-arginine translocase subunit TatC [Candidatus Altiarchaeota archaeon]